VLGLCQMSSLLRPTLSFGNLVMCAVTFGLECDTYVDLKLLVRESFLFLSFFFFLKHFVVIISCFLSFISCLVCVFVIVGISLRLWCRAGEIFWEIVGVGCSSSVPEIWFPRVLSWIADGCDVCRLVTSQLRQVKETVDWRHL